MPRLTLRIDLDDDRAIGPGKIRLLELVDELGSISGAGRRMKMAYRRAWLLVDSLNQYFREPVVVSQAGGSHGGGAALTEFGRQVVRHYRAVEAAAQAAGAPEITALVSAVSEKPVVAATRAVAAGRRKRSAANANNTRAAGDGVAEPLEDRDRGF